MSDWLDDAAVERIMFAVAWSGPWDRLCSWLCHLHDFVGRDRLICWADDRDRTWATRHLENGTVPHRRWRR